MPNFPVIPVQPDASDWWHMWDYPTRLFDQFFGVELYDKDLLIPTNVRGFTVRPRTQANILVSGQSKVTNDDKKFEVSLNVSQFKPDEVKVSVVDNFIAISGKHEERDDQGLVSRSLKRRYMLPPACDAETITARLDAEGILTVKVSKKTTLDDSKEVKVPMEVESATKESKTEN